MNYIKNIIYYIFVLALFALLLFSTIKGIADILGVDTIELIKDIKKSI